MRSTRMKPRLMEDVPHPGWDCCDMSRDLAGWIKREKEGIGVGLRWARVYRSRGERLRKEALKVLCEGDTRRAAMIDGMARRAFGYANEIRQGTWSRLERVMKVERAHEWRLRD